MLFSYCWKLFYLSSRYSMFYEEELLNIQTAVTLPAKMTVQLVQFGVGELAGTWSTAAWTGLTFWKRFAEGRLQRPQGRLRQRAANYRRAVHHSSCGIPSETHTKGGVERLYRSRDNTGRYLRGDDASLWNHGPTGWAQIDRASLGPSVCLPVFLSVVSVPVRCLSLQSRMAKSGVFLSPSLCLSLTSMVLFLCRWCSLSFFHSASFRSRWPLSNSSDVPLHV